MVALCVESFDHSCKEIVQLLSIYMHGQTITLKVNINFDASGSWIARPYLLKMSNVCDILEIGGKRLKKSACLIYLTISVTSLFGCE